MGYVAATAALFALGAWLGRDLAGVAGIVAFIASFGCLIGMRFAARTSLQLTVGLLGAFGLLTVLAMGSLVAYYASAVPAGAAGGGRGHRPVHRRDRGGLCTTRRDLAVVARACFWALVALIVFGIVLIFVQIPGGALVNRASAR